MTHLAAEKDSYILLELAGTTYGIRSGDVRHMEMLNHITPVPNAAPFVEGVVFSRGEVIPAINLRLRFGLPRENVTIRSRLIVVDVNQRRVGLIVDAAREFQNIPAESVQPPNEAVVAMGGKYLAGVAIIGQRPILLLSVREILNFQQAGETSNADPASSSRLNAEQFTRLGCGEAAPTRAG